MNLDEMSFDSVPSFVIIEQIAAREGIRYGRKNR